MAEYTNQDALLAELLGDVGLLHDAVNSLKDVLPNQTEEAVQHLTEIIGSIEKAGDAYLTKKDASLTAHRIQLDNDIIEANLEFKRNLGELISGYETAIETKFTTPVKEMLRAVQQSKHSPWKMVLLASLFSGAFGGLSMRIVETYWTTPIKERDELAQEVEQLKQTQAQAKTWGVTFTENEDGQYIVLPPGKTIKPGPFPTTKGGKRKAIKLED